MSGIDKFAYKSRLFKVRAGDKLLAALAIMFICLFFGSMLVSLATVILMSAATLVLGGCRPKSYIKLLLVPLAFLLTGVLTVIINRLDASVNVLFSFNFFGVILGITHDSLLIGTRLLLKAMGAVTCLYFFSLNTPMNSFLSLLRRKTPGLLVELMELIYRFTFLIWYEAQRIHMAQASRLGYDGLVNSIKSLGELLTNVFIRAFKRASRLSLSLEARGFDGSFEFLVEEETPGSLLNILTLVAAIVLIIIGLLERLKR